MTYAGFWKRVAAYLIDIVILSPAIFILALVEQIDGYFAIGILASTLTWWLYFALFESRDWQATPGKRLLNIRVTNLDGERITFLRATARHFAKYLSGLILGIGYLMVAFTQKKQALHDIIADTLVLSGSTSNSATHSENEFSRDENTFVAPSDHKIVRDGLIFAGFDSNGHVVRLKFDFNDPKLNSDGLILGRDSQSCDLHISDQSISRRHARLFKRGQEIWIQDLGSTNGIIVNGKSINSGESDLLTSSGTLAIGGIQLALGRD